MVLINHNAADFCRRQCVDDELCRIRRPQYYVNAFAADFVGNGIDAAAAYADTGSLGIDALVVGFDGDFGAMAGIACGFADFQQAVCNFRYFLFKQFGQEFARGTAEDDLFASGLADFFNTQKQGADAVAAAEIFARNGLVARDERVQFARNEFHDDAVAFDPFHCSDNDVFPGGEEVVQDFFAFGIADALQDNLLGRHCGLAAEAFVFDLLFVVFADLDGGAGDFFLDFLNGFFHIGIGVILIGHNQPAAEGAVFSGIPVDFDAHVHVFSAGFFLCSRG